jgi:hypothetical protein
VTSPRDPRALKIGAAVVAAQGLGLVAAGFYLLVRAFGSDVTNRTIAALDVVWALGGGLLLLRCARGLVRLRYVVRVPVFIVEFITIPVGIGLFQGHQWGWGVLVLGSGLVAMAALIRGLPRPGDG